MPTVLKNIFILAILCAFLPINTLAQKNKNTSSKNKSLKIDPDTSFLHSILFGMLNNESINYFINERESMDSLWFGKERRAVHIDSLLPIHKGYIDDFIYRSYSYRSYSNNNKENYEFTTPPLKSIYAKLQPFWDLNYRYRNENRLPEIKNLITNLPNSKEKVSLFIQYGHLTITNETDRFNVADFCSNAETYAKKITNLYDRGMAYRYIGEFAAHYQISDSAIRLYYLARESIENCKIDLKRKYYEQGTLCDRLSNVFDQVHLQQASEKAEFYSLNASQYFEKSGQTNQAEMYDMFTISSNAYLWANFGSYHDNDQDLEILRDWYNSFRGNTQFDDYTNYLGLFSIGSYLYGTNGNIALRYYLESFYYATRGTYTTDITAVFENIISLYTFLGKNKLAIGYSDLQLYLAKGMNNNFEIYQALLRKGYTFYGLNNYDSALVYANRILFDTNLNKIFYPLFSNQLLEKASKLKYQTLDLYKHINNDSARIYENKYTEYQTEHLKNLVDLVDIELKSINDWLTRSKDKVITSEKELKEAALSDEKFALEKANRDSLERKKSDSIVTLTNTLRKTEKADAEIALNTEKLIRIKNEEIAKKEMLYYITGSFVLFIISVWYFRQRNKNRSNKLIAEYNRVNELAKNKIHNIENDYSEIGNLLEDNEVNKLKRYVSNYEAFLAIFLENWKKEKVTLEDELEATKRYFTAKAILEERLVLKIENSVEEPQTVKYIQSVFDTLLDNSVRHGFENKAGTLQFTIIINKVNSVLECIVTDNGIPPEKKEYYLAGKESGLNILKKRILGFYAEQKIKVKKDFFEIDLLPDSGGTIVNIKLPYAKI